jgi:Ser/Thr protein kinase RdoA (MazF antagonist)
MQVPDSVLTAYGLDDAVQQHVPSLINATFILTVGSNSGSTRFVLQRLHPVFGPSVNRDIDAVTQHLSAKGLVTPRLVRTLGGDLWHVDEETGPGSVWRVLSYVPGETVHQSRDPQRLSSGARLLGAFHAALDDFHQPFVHKRPLHDTAKHLGALKAALGSSAAKHDAEAQALGARVLRHAEGIVEAYPDQPKRVVHGDPKLSNLLFDLSDPDKALCMIDLDTVGRGALAYELGDALRSWCNPVGEDLGAVTVDVTLVDAVVSGYFQAAPVGIQRSEILSAIDGLETVSCELSSRFAADAILDCYFGWDSARFSSRRAHNLVRAEGQLALSRDVRAKRALLKQHVERAFVQSRHPRR